jgi:hypothetical protein
MKETNLYLISLGKRWCRSALAAIPICLGLTMSAEAESGVIRLAPSFEDVAYFPMLLHETVAEVLDRQDLAVEAYVRGIDSCQELLAIPDGAEHGFDKTQMTYVTILKIKVECWALLQLDQDAKIAPMERSDKLGEDAVEGIRAFSENLPLELDLWPGVLTAVNGAVIGCNGMDRCELSAPDGSDWEDYTMHFRLLLVDGERKYISVTEAYEGRRNFVFGAIWSDRAGRVLAMFPKLN